MTPKLSSHSSLGVLTVALLLGQLASLGAATDLTAAQQWVQAKKLALQKESSLSQMVMPAFAQAMKSAGLAAGPGTAGTATAAAGGGLTGGQWGSGAALQQMMKGSSLFGQGNGLLGQGNGDLLTGISGLDAAQNAAINGALSLVGSELANRLGPLSLHGRLQQLGQIWTDIEQGDEACGAYVFNTGGSRTNARWTGPTLVLTQTTGNCIVKFGFAGEDDTRWTRLQETVACLEPSTQYGWTPLTYTGVSEEPTTLDGPECKYEVKFGPTVTITLTADGHLVGDDETDDKVIYESEADFYADVVSKHSGFGHTDSTKAMLEAALAKLNKGYLSDLQSAMENSGPASNASSSSAWASLLGQGANSGQQWGSGGWLQAWKDKVAAAAAKHPAMAKMMDAMAQASQHHGLFRQQA